MSLWHENSARYGLEGVRYTLLALACLLLVALGVGLQGQGRFDNLFLSQAGSTRLATRQSEPPFRLPDRKGPADPSPREEALRRDIEAQFSKVPVFQAFFDRFRLAFPIDYDLTVQRGIARAEAAGKVETPEQYVLDAISVLRRGRGLLAAHASDLALARLFDLQSQTMTALAQIDPGLCVGFLYGTAATGFIAFAATHRDLVADMANAGLDAVIDGQANRVARSAPSEADFQHIESDLTARGLAPNEIDALLDGRVPTPALPDDRFCKAALSYLDVLKGLPPGMRAAIYSLSVELMSRS